MGFLGSFLFLFGCFYVFLVACLIVIVCGFMLNRELCGFFWSLVYLFFCFGWINCVLGGVCFLVVFMWCVLCFLGFFCLLRVLWLISQFFVVLVFAFCFAFVLLLTFVLCDHSENYDEILDW